MENNEVRLQKYLADNGICSRRKAEEHIENEEVRVNGRVATLGQKVNSKKDRVEFQGKVVDTKFQNRDEKVYIILNKPCGYVTTLNDEKGRKTVMDLVEIDRRVVPVGRLDINTSGAILLSNDGDFIYELTHPKHEISKTYNVIVEGLITYEAIDMLEKGVEIEGYKTKPAKVEVSYVDDKTNTSKIQIKIHEGKNRQIRKMCEEVGFQVKKLNRTLIGELGIKDLKLGSWRYLTKKETVKLGYEKAVIRLERDKGFGKADREKRDRKYAEKLKAKIEGKLEEKKSGKNTQNRNNNRKVKDKNFRRNNNGKR